jgi:hypothetical protein
MDALQYIHTQGGTPSMTTSTFSDFVATRPVVEAQVNDVLRYTESLVNALDENYRLYTVKSHQSERNNSEYHEQCLEQILKGTYDYRTNFYIVEGRKYLRIEMETGVNHDGSVTQKSIHAFIDKNTGEVYKPATWKSPAKHVRYNLMDKQSREQCYRNADWAGSYLYMK